LSVVAAAGWVRAVGSDAARCILAPACWWPWAEQPTLLRAGAWILVGCLTPRARCSGLPGRRAHSRGRRWPAAVKIWASASTRLACQVSTASSTPSTHRALAHHRPCANAV